MESGQGDDLQNLELMPAVSQDYRHDGEVACCAVAPDNRYVMSGGWDGHLRAWAAEDGRLLADIQVGAKPLTACGVTPQGDRWLAANLDGLLLRYDAESHQQVSSFLAHPRPISCIAHSAAGKPMATASWDTHVILWHAHWERQGEILAGHHDIVSGCSLSAAGHRLVSASYDCTVRVWDTEILKALATLKGHTDRITCVAISQDGLCALSGSRDGGLKLWDLAANTEFTAKILPGEIKACFFLLDGTTVATVESVGTVRLFTLPTLAQTAQLDTGLAVHCASLAPSGAMIVLGAGDGSIHRVAVDNFDWAPLSTTALSTNRQTATRMQKLLGQSRLIKVLLCTCPVCREPFEVPAGHGPNSASCPNCRRKLRINTVLAAEGLV
jgi:WD40 repeat protein